MARKPHAEVLQDIAEQAQGDPPLYAFALFTYRDRTDFHHSLNADGPTVAEGHDVLDGLATHIAAVAETSDSTVDAVLQTVLDNARHKAKTPPDELGGR